MKSYRDNAEFLHLISEDGVGLKFLTHDFSGKLDFLEYLYRCQRLVLSSRQRLQISNSIYNLIRGFVFGPEWIDYKGRVHKFFISSEEAVSYYEQTGKHPLWAEEFAKDIEDFRNSIRFRSGRLDLLFKNTLQQEFPALRLEISGSLGLADMYTDTGAVRNALKLILGSMTEYQDRFPRVVIAYTEDVVEDSFLKSTISLTQVGSFPNHELSHDMARLSEGDGGTFGTIRKLLTGLCNWAVISKWPDRDSAVRWRILHDETEEDLSEAKLADGFTHAITIYHKP